MTEEQRADGRNLALLSLLTTILFADVLFFGSNFFQRDLYRYHFPMKRVVRDTIAAGYFPYWNRLLAAGQPMAANPAYEVFYPLQWLIFVGPYDFGFALHIVAHVYLAVAGMYLLARTLGCSGAVAVLAAVSFSFGGFLLGTMMMLPTFFVWAWAPLAGWAVVRMIRAPSPRRFAVAALILGMQMLIGEPMALMQVWVLCGAAAVWTAFTTRDPAQRDVAPLVFALFPASLAIAAVQFIPAIDHARDSIRSRGLAFGVVADFSLHVLRPLEFLVPHAFGTFDGQKLAVWGQMFFPRGTPYLVSLSCGLAVTILVIAGVLARVRGWQPLLATAAVTYILAIGDVTPVWRWLYVAGVRSLRYPEKFIATLVFAMVIFAAVVAQKFLDGDAPVRARVRTASLLVVVVNGLLTVALFLPGAQARFVSILKIPHGFEDMYFAARSAIPTGLGIAIGWLLLVELSDYSATRAWRAAVLVLLLADVAPLGRGVSGTLPREFFTPPAFASQLRDGSVFHRGEWDASQPNHRKIRALPSWWGGRNSLQPLTNAAWGIESVMELDYDETALLPTHEILDLLRRHGSRGGEQWADRLMTLSNVRYVLDFRDPAVALREAGGDISKARLVDITRLPSRGKYYGPDVRVLRVEETPNSATIEVEASKPAVLAATVTRHKYWTATVDGQNAELLPANIAYQAVRVPAGRHRVEMRYRNPLIAWGGLISLAATLAALITILRRLRRTRHIQ